MKITTNALYFEDATLPDGIVVYTGTGTTAAADTVFDESFDFGDDLLMKPRSDAQGNWWVNIVSGGKRFEIELRKVENYSWANSEAGAHAAILVLRAWKKKSDVGALPTPGTVGNVLTDDGTAWVSAPPAASPGVVVQAYTWTASLQEVVLPTGITGTAFLYQVFEVIGTDEIPSPAIQIFFNTLDSKWYVDLSLYQAVSAKVKFYQ